MSNGVPSTGVAADDTVMRRGAHTAAPPCSKLKHQWEEKVAAIGSLEENLTKLQSGFSEREQQLEREREQACQQLKWVSVSTDVIVSTSTYL